MSSGVPIAPSPNLFLALPGTPYWLHSAIVFCSIIDINYLTINTCSAMGSLTFLDSLKRYPFYYQYYITQPGIHLDAWQTIQHSWYSALCRWVKKSKLLISF